MGKRPPEVGDVSRGRLGEENGMRQKLRYGRGKDSRELRGVLSSAPDRRLWLELASEGKNWKGERVKGVEGIESLAVRAWQSGDS